MLNLSVLKWWSRVILLLNLIVTYRPVEQPFRRLRRKCACFFQRLLQLSLPKRNFK
ncbi:hypothetical protein ZOSMA_136G00160 [Zostera marina]|uniref:Uncharacterized protein n=1 Tax=Zostera marina TaxID=29655 RepID=A0A0K9PYA7_ZOSMR|nr:hypothetical protein ZOSMA_136G00160 [Zostera marina]